MSDSRDRSHAVEGAASSVDGASADRAEVTAEVVAAILDEARARGLEDRLLTRGVGLGVRELTMPGGRVSWQCFRTLMANLREYWSDAELFEVGAALVPICWPVPIPAFGRFFLHPVDLYVWSCDSGRTSRSGHFGALVERVDELGPRRLRITSTTRRGHEPCRELEQLLRGARAALPRTIGMPPAEVAMRPLTNGAIYDIALPEPQFAPLRRFATAALLERENVRALASSYDELDARNRDLGDRIRSLESRIAQHEQIEAALRSSEERFRVLAESSRDLIVEVDRLGRCVYASPNHMVQLGVSPEQMIGERLMRWVHPDDEAAVLHSMRSLDRRGGVYQAVFRYQHAEGSWRWFESVGKRYASPEGDFRLVTIARDITDRLEKEREERRREQAEAEARLRALEGKLALETQIAELSRRFLDLATDDIDDAIRDALASVGSEVRADCSYLITVDLQESRVESLYEWPSTGAADRESTIADRMARYQQPGGVELANFAWSLRRLLRGEAVALSRVEDLPTEAAEERRELMSRGVKSIVSLPLRSGRALLGFLCFEAWRQPVVWRDDDLALLGLIGQIFMSALRRKRAEEALRESQHQLIQSQRMEALGQLAGGIAHDFNNLLMVIGGCAEALLKSDVVQDQVEDLEEIQAAATRAASLTQQLLAFSRRQPFAPRRVDLNEVVLGLRPMLSRVIGEHIELRPALEPAVDPVLGDAAQIEQLLVNLAVNARDAMPDGGTVEVRTGNRELTASEARGLGLTTAGRYAELSVSDSGTGIEERQKERIFEPFYTTKEVGRGTGLGLAIVYGIVRQSGGAIRVESELGRGSTFRIWLPSASDAAETAPRTEGGRASGGSETLLLVEDEPAVRRLVARECRAKGYEVLEACDGLDGLRVASEHAGEVSLVISDVVMPNMGGGEMAELLLARHPALRVIFISGYADERAAEPDLSDALVLRKPFDLDSLLAAIRQQLDERVGDAARPDEGPQKQGFERAPAHSGHDE